jgi:hypothetical protein
MHRLLIRTPNSSQEIADGDDAVVISGDLSAPSLAFLLTCLIDIVSRVDASVPENVSLEAARKSESKTSVMQFFFFFFFFFLDLGLG